MEEKEINRQIELIEKYSEVSDGHSLTDIIIALIVFMSRIMKKAEPTLDRELAANGLITYINDILEGEHELRKEDEQ